MTEEKIEYRDEHGNLLDEEQVKALEGKVSFSTRYETRTRLVDQDGREVEDGVVVDDEGQSARGTLAEAPQPGTANVKGEGDASTAPPKAGVREDVVKEESVQGAKATPEPEGEVGRETGRDEL